MRFPYTKGQQQITGNGKKIADLPGGGYNQHWTRNVVAAPNGISCMSRLVHNQTLTKNRYLVLLCR
jgi:hypothetical protein